MIPEMSNKTSLLNRIFAILIILALSIVFVQRLYLNRSDIYHSFGEGAAGIKNSIKNVYGTLPRNDYFEQLHYEYLQKTGRGHFNGVTFLNDGRLILDNLDPVLYQTQRTNTIIETNNYFAEKGIPFVYMRIPNKLFEQSELPLAFSDNQIIKNGDMLTESIRNNFVDTYDLRAQMQQADKNFAASFYCFDLHWNYETILWVSQNVGDFMNRQYGFDIDLSIWDIDRYDQFVQRRLLYGSESKTAGAHCILEDITFLSPKFPVDLEMRDSKHDFAPFTSNDFFGLFIPKFYGDHNHREEPFTCVDKGLPGEQFTEITNNLAEDDKRVLIISDSFAVSWVPYFSLGFKNIDFIYLITYQTHKVIWDYLAEKDYDLVIFAISDVMVSIDSQPVYEEFDRFYLGTPPER